MQEGKDYVLKRDSRGLLYVKNLNKKNVVETKVNQPEEKKSLDDLSKKELTKLAEKNGFPTEGLKKQEILELLKEE